MNHTQLEVFGLNSYHNSVGERDEKKLAVYEQTNKAQEDTVFALMLDSKRTWTSWELHQKLGPAMLESSVRRCLTNLGNEGIIGQTGELRPGGRGRSVIVWRVKELKTKI